MSAAAPAAKESSFNLFPEVQNVTWNDKEIDRKGCYYSVLYVILLIISLVVLIVVYALRTTAIAMTINKPTYQQFLDVQANNPTCACTRTSMRKSTISRVTNDTTLCNQVSSLGLTMGAVETGVLDPQVAMCRSATRFAGLVMQLYGGSTYSSVTASSLIEFQDTLQDDLSMLVSTYKTIYSYPHGVLRTLLQADFPLAVYDKANKTIIPNQFAVPLSRVDSFAKTTMIDIGSMNIDCFAPGNWDKYDYFSSGDFSTGPVNDSRFTRACDAWMSGFVIDRTHLTKKWDWLCPVSPTGGCPTQTGTCSSQYSDAVCVDLRSVLASMLQRGYVSFQDAFNDLFGIGFNVTGNHQAYFGTCAPESCKWVETRQPTAIEVITTVLGLFGGLNALLRGVIAFLLGNSVEPVIQRVRGESTAAVANGAPQAATEMVAANKAAST